MIFKLIPLLLAASSPQLNFSTQSMSGVWRNAQYPEMVLIMAEHYNSKLEIILHIQPPNKKPIVTYFMGKVFRTRGWITITATTGEEVFSRKCTSEFQLRAVGMNMRVEGTKKFRAILFLFEYEKCGGKSKVKPYDFSGVWIARPPKKKGTTI